MPSRKQSGAASAGRVQALLARPPGWVPPPEPGDAQGDGRARWDPSPTAAADAGADAGTDNGADNGADDAGARGVPGPSRVTALLPLAVRTGRLDPGRRSAVALVLVVLLAALVTGGVLLRGRPQEVLVPQVLSRGAPLPGTAPSGTAPPGTAPPGTSGPGTAPPGTSGPEAGGPAGPGGTAEVVVAVAGKVVRPGLVRLPAGSRVDDAVRAAGGPVAGASPGLLNLARRLVDGEQVLVGVEPAPGTPATTSGGGAASGGAAGGGAAGGGAAGGLLDLNAATVADLDDLPGIGPVLAQRILDWRTEHQRFASVDQLREVTGIGEAKYQDLKAQVTV